MANTFWNTSVRYKVDIVKDARTYFSSSTLAACYSHSSVSTARANDSHVLLQQPPNHDPADQFTNRFDQFTKTNNCKSAAI